MIVPAFSSSRKLSQSHPFQVNFVLISILSVLIATTPNNNATPTHQGQVNCISSEGWELTLTKCTPLAGSGNLLCFLPVIYETVNLREIKYVLMEVEHFWRTAAHAGIKIYRGGTLNDAVQRLTVMDKSMIDFSGHSAPKRTRTNYHCWWGIIYYFRNKIGVQLERGDRWGRFR